MLKVTIKWYNKKPELEFTKIYHGVHVNQIYETYYVNYNRSWNYKNKLLRFDQVIKILNSKTEALIYLNCDIIFFKQIAQAKISGTLRMSKSVKNFIRTYKENN